MSWSTPPAPGTAWSPFQSPTSTPYWRSSPGGASRLPAWKRSAVDARRRCSIPTGTRSPSFRCPPRFRVDRRPSTPVMENRDVVVKLVVAVHEAESSPEKGPLRSEVVKGRVGDHPRQSVFGGHCQQGDDRLCGVAVDAGGWNQAVDDLDASVGRPPFEADSADGPSIGQAGDPVEAERLLLPAGAGGVEESSYCADVSFEGEIQRPRIVRTGTSGDDALSFRDIDRVEL